MNNLIINARNFIHLKFMDSEHKKYLFIKIKRSNKIIKNLCFIKKRNKLNIFEKDRYQIGNIGRIKINTKLYKKQFWRKNETLKPEDILGTVNYLLKLNSGFG